MKEFAPRRPRKQKLFAAQEQILLNYTELTFEDKARGIAILYLIGWLDGWMTCDSTSFSIVFWSYQEDGWMIMKGCVQWNPIYG